MPTVMSFPSGARRIAGNLLIYGAGLLLIASSASKFAHVPVVVSEMTSLGLTGPKLILVACLEVSTGLLFLFGPARSLGLLVISSYMGGVICAHIVTDQYLAVVPASVVLGSCWLGAFLRHPQILWSLGRGPDAAEGRARQTEGPHKVPEIAS